MKDIRGQVGGTHALCSWETRYDRAELATPGPPQGALVSQSAGRGRALCFTSPAPDPTTTLTTERHKSNSMQHRWTHSCW